MRCPTGTRTCVDGMPDAIAFLMIELCKKFVAKF